MPNQTVTITVVNHQLQVSPDPAYISVSRKEEVVWEIAQDEDFDVEFAQNAPFANRQFHGRRGTPARSGAANQGTEDRDYKYTVRVPGKKPLDPTVRPTP